MLWKKKVVSRCKKEDGEQRPEDGNTGEVRSSCDVKRKIMRVASCSYRVS